MALHVFSRPYILLNYPQSCTLYWHPVFAGSVQQKYLFLSNSFITFIQTPEITFFELLLQRMLPFIRVYTQVIWRAF